MTRGFLASANRELVDAQSYFEKAIHLDSHLANARLGLGLILIRRGYLDKGMENLQIAAALEPNRSLLRSYLGKAYANAGKDAFAEREFDLATFFDANDPTPRLYTAIFLQSRNEPNKAIKELEESVRLNDNRRLFRSKLLLDQDRAVRGANLAGLYRDSGMTDRSVSEASRSLEADYGNYSSHLFLAQSYNLLRDSGDINLRYETPAFSEFLVANLLAPVDSGTLGTEISSGDYSRLFEKDRFGLTSATEFHDNGEWTQSASQYGHKGDSAYSLDLNYLNHNGYRPNQDNEVIDLRARIKNQLSRKDSVYFDLDYNERERGDLRRVHSEDEIDPTLRSTEKQAPNVLLGYHRQWSPGSQTLALMGVLNSDASSVSSYEVAPGIPASASLDREYNAYLAGVQHTLVMERNTFVVGGRYQQGEIQAATSKSLISPPFLLEDISTTEDWERIGLYAYDTFEPLNSLKVTAGLTYDNVRYPTLIDSATTGAERTSRLSPKFGLRWDPNNRTSVYASYTQSLSGVGPEQSYRLEPTQVGGFNQAYRSVAPEDLGGSAAAAHIEASGLGLDHVFAESLYVGTRLRLLRSEAKSHTSQSFSQVKNSHEDGSVSAYLDWLIGDQFSTGLSYEVSSAKLERRSSATSIEGKTWEGVLQRIRLESRFQHGSGFFAIMDAELFDQDNKAGLRDETFWMLNARIGYHFANRRAQVSIGVLNLLDQDYELSPVNFYREPARERTVVVTLRLNY